MTKVEEVKAVLAANGLDACSEHTLETAARAAIAAMRTPTKEMLTAMIEQDPLADQATWDFLDRVESDATDIWQAAIDAALKETP